MRKNTLVQRLNIIKGQIDGLISLLGSEKDCRKVAIQFDAINIAFKKSMEMYFKQNLVSCLKSVNFKKRNMVEFLLKEIIKNK